MAEKETDTDGVGHGIQNETSSPQVGPTEVYYYYLYHHIAHWAAYVAMMGVLLTIGFFLALTPITGDLRQQSLRFRFGVIAFVIAASLGAALYFLLAGMNSYGGKTNRCLPNKYQPQKRREYRAIGLGLAGAIVLAIVDSILLCSIWK